MDKVLKGVGHYHSYRLTIWKKSKRRIVSASLLLHMFCCLTFVASAEGTKELRPTENDHGSIQLYANNGSGSTFATYNGKVQERMNVRVCNVGEMVYLGFARKGNLSVRVMSPSGKVVVDLTPLTGGEGVITTYDQAVAGPNAFDPSGYEPISFKAEETGDYYIEFQNSGVASQSTLNLFDVTVANNGVVKKGRLWSSAWMLNVDDFTNQFNGEMFIYTDDQITTKVNFNGIKPYEFVISSNSTGTQNSGNPAQDRKSVFDNKTYPQYKIFLNEPDTACFPTGDMGEIVGDASITGCPGDYCINVNVTAPGTMLFTIDGNGLPGYQSGTKDRLIQATLKKGKNCVKWDGKDGLGNQVGDSTTVSLSINYVNGMTHLPIFDVENHENGYAVSYVRPKPTASSANITLFWDDSGMTKGSPIDALTNLQGCESAGGCHKWKDRGINGNCTFNSDCPETINTWWYVKESNANVVYNSLVREIDANRSTPGKGRWNDTTVCASAKEIQLKGKLIGDTLQRWTKLVGSGSVANPDSLLTRYTLSAADAALDTLVLVLSSVSACPVIKDTLRIALEPMPSLVMPPSKNICSNNTQLEATASFAHARGLLWTGTGGAFQKADTTSIVYTPSQQEIDVSKVVLYASTLARPGQLCPMVTDSVVFGVYLPPTLQLPTDTTLCALSAKINWEMAAESTESDSVVWKTSLAGRNPTPRQGIKTYVEIADTNRFKVYATAYKKGCLPLTDSFHIAFEPRPQISAVATPTCLPSMLVQLSATLSKNNKPASGKWSSNGTGQFVKPLDSLNANGYLPSQQDSTQGEVRFQLVSTDQKYCPPKDTLIRWAIIPLPKAEAGPDTLVCANARIARVTPFSMAWKYYWREGKAGAVISQSDNLSFKATKDTFHIFLTVENSRKCKAVDSATVVTLKPPTIQLPTDFCLYHAKDLVADIQNKPVVGMFSWYRNDSLLLQDATSLIADKVGTYSLRYDYQGTCSTEARVKALPTPQVDVSDTSACQNQSVQLTATAIQDVDYYWGNSAIQTSINRMTLNAANGIQDYKVLVVDRNGCRDSAYADVVVYPNPVFSLLAKGLCPGESSFMQGTLEQPDLASKHPISYKWSKDGKVLPEATTSQLTYTQAGTYQLEMALEGCKVQRQTYVSMFPKPEATLEKNLRHCFETEPPLVLSSSKSHRYYWFSEGVLVDSTPTIQVAPEQDTKYALVVENNYGCKDSAETVVRVVCPPRLFVPNVITPESNDVNAGLHIFGAHYTNFEITIFSRWGEVIYNTKDPKHAWDGLYRNENMPIGTYQWLVTYEGDSEEYKGPYKKTGDVTIVR